MSKDLTLHGRWPPVDGRGVGRGGKTEEKLPPRPRESKCAKRESEELIGKLNYGLLWESGKAFMDWDHCRLLVT